MDDQSAAFTISAKLDPVEKEFEATAPPVECAAKMEVSIPASDNN